MALYLHNTLGKSRQLFEPADPNRVTMYVCGPTVYSYPHIGNARPEVVFDVLARLLRRSYRLVYVRNITDVDDKINAAAADEGITIGELTERYTECFHEDMAALGVEPPDYEPRVTGHMPEIIGFIERLIASGHAYEADGHVLFSVPSFPAYGRLSGRSRDDMIAGARVDVAPYKHYPADFVLWKPSDAGTPGWDSPWGRGRPGWHIECSAMVEAHLGKSIDIHGGGQDLVFPHHENETAQSTCAHAGAPFARFWLHNGMIHVDSEKMSKSVGNVLVLRDLLAEHPGEAIRMALLTAHYRQPLDWSDGLVDEAMQKLDRLYGALRQAGIEGPAGGAPDDVPDEVVEALDDDLNTPKALAALFGLARAANRSDDAGERLEIAQAMRAGGWLLGFLQRDPEAWFSAAPAGAGAGSSDAEIDALVAERDQLRADRRFTEADLIRERLTALGVVIEDGPTGSRWRRR